MSFGEADAETEYQGKEKEEDDGEDDAKGSALVATVGASPDARFDAGHASNID